MAGHFHLLDNVRTADVRWLKLRGQYSVAYGTQSARWPSFASIPTLLIFIFFQKYFIRGLTLARWKG